MAYIPQEGTKRGDVYKLYFVNKNEDIENISNQLHLSTNQVLSIIKVLNFNLNRENSTDTLVQTAEFVADTTINTDDWVIPTIGADPEFVISHPVIGKISASSIFTRSMKARAGCDGCSSTGEIRPKQECNAFKLSKNVRRCLLTVKKHLLEIERYKESKIVCGAGAHGTPIGGHIHFGTEENENLVKGLAMASILTMNLGNNNSYSLQRKNNNYGRLLDARTQPWGMEYRSNISWIQNPEFTTKLLALNHLIVIEYLNNRTEFDKLKSLFKQIYVTKFKNQSFSSGSLAKIQKEVIKVISNFKSFKANVHNYGRILIPFFEECLKAKPVNKIVYVDEEAWHLPNTVVIKPIVPKKVRLVQFSDDDYMQILEHQFDNPLVTQGTSLRIIGLNESRTFQVSTSNNFTYKVIVQDFCAEKGLIYSEVEDFGDVIGFRRDVRQNNQDLILELLCKIKQTVIQLVPVQEA